MTRQAIIEKTLKAISLLPENKAEEISDFADYVTKKYEDQKLTDAIQQIVTDSKTFAFLESEEELYTVADLKVVYNGKR
jgi:CheY-like chemotaxis protein